MIWDRGRIWLTEGENPSSWDDRCTRNLLLTCKTMYAEISYMVYSNNQLVLKYKKGHSFQPFRNLLPTSIEFLSDVIILLNTSSCPDGVCCRMKRRLDLSPSGAWSCRHILVYTMSPYRSHHVQEKKLFLSKKIQPNCYLDTSVRRS